MIWFEEAKYMQLKNSNTISLKMEESSAFGNVWLLCQYIYFELTTDYINKEIQQIGYIQFVGFDTGQNTNE